MGRAYEVRREAMQKTHAAKSKLYAKFGREIYLAAKNGIPDPNINLNLKRVIEKAKSKDVPNDIINRAIEKAQSKEVDNYTENLYEGFGPGGSTLLIECLTDNPNRTISFIKASFNKTKSKLASSGAVSFGYRHCSVVTLSNIEEEIVAEHLFNNEIEFDDIEKDEEFVSVFGETQELYNIKSTLEDLLNEHVKMVEDEITYIANEEIKLNEEDEKQFIKLIELLEDIDDVQKVYHNVSLS